MWTFRYDQNYKNLKKILTKEIENLKKTGQFEIAFKVAELVGNYAAALSCLLLAGSKEEYEELKVKFFDQKVFSYGNYIVELNTFNLDKDEKYKYKVSYHKVLDNHTGEPFLFSNQEFKLKNETKLIKNNSKGLRKKTAAFGENMFEQYVIEETGNLVEIINIINQKIEHYYGIDNADEKRGKTVKLKEFMETTHIHTDVKQGDEQANEKTNLVSYIHFHEVNENVAYDASIYENDAILIGDYEMTGDLAEDQPMESEDKWGKACPPAQGVVLNANSSVSVDFKTALVNSWTVEFYMICNGNGVFLTLGNLSISVEDMKVKFRNEGVKIDPIVVKDYAFETTYMHFCFIFENDNIKFLFQGSLSEVILVTPSVCYKLVFGNGFYGVITEIRVWNVLLSDSFIRDHMGVPLNVLLDKKSKIKMKINKSEEKKGAKMGLQSKFISRIWVWN